MSITFRCLRNNQQNTTNHAHKRAVSAFTFDGLGRAYTGSHDGTLKSWSSATLEGLSCADECGCWVNDLVHVGGDTSDRLRTLDTLLPSFHNTFLFFRSYVVWGERRNQRLEGVTGRRRETGASVLHVGPFVHLPLISHSHNF